MFLRHDRRLGSLLAALLTLSNVAFAGDWTRFRGENGSGVSNDAKNLPTKWSDKENIAWKVKLPGPGSSSPIVVGDKVFVTCWSGYGTSDSEGGAPSNLKRHLVCLDRSTGKVLWDKAIPAALPEDEYGGMFAEHGFASHTPTSDGAMVYVFFGKSGVFGFDMDGNQKWEAKVGEGLDRRRWGSASSPILYKDTLIVLAAAESQTIYGFDKKTGKELWKKPAPNFDSTWGTPILVQNSKGKDELVVGVPGEIWGFNPENGGFLWYCPVADEDSYRSSVIADKDVIFSFEGRGGVGLAVRAGGSDDASKSNLVWKVNERNGIGSPLLVDGKIYLFSNRIANCVDAATGKQLYQERLPAGPSSSPATGGGGGRGQGGPGGPGGRRGGGMGGQDYGSPVFGDGKIYYVTRSGEMHVIKAGPTFEHLSVNRVTDQTEDFSATPAIVGNQILVRSSAYLYCIGKP